MLSPKIRSLRYDPAGLAALLPIIRTCRVHNWQPLPRHEWFLRVRLPAGRWDLARRTSVKHCTGVDPDPYVPLDAHLGPAGDSGAGTA